MWDKPATLRQVTWLAAALTVGAVGVSTTYGDRQNQVNAQRDYATCLERKLNITLTNENWTKVVVKPGAQLAFNKLPTCTKP